MNHHLIDSEASVTRFVIAAMSDTQDPRLKRIMECAVQHLHAFARECDLSEDELEAGLRFITEIGQQTHHSHNEVVLAADVLGLSTLVALRNNPSAHGQTAAALLGPFWRKDAPICTNGESIARTPSSHPSLEVSGYVRDDAGNPITQAQVDVWQASPTGLYENQDAAQEDMNLRGRFLTDDKGRYLFKTVRPAGYPVPTDGSVGKLLRAQKRHPYRPAHIHFMVSAPGHKTLITQVFADDSEYLSTDVVLGVTKALVGMFQEKDGCYSLNYDFVLQEGISKFPEPPIK
ncbi:dioxygenase [Polaromonas sp. JS666]|uniref:dioxygenase family protein n=1 Tax=Polaromonas sp. (strain JS666 / ATCC BAA-500) TaxID=296591 RepID=UPI0000D5B351|nr:dioxygenase [Polaromonas sp. JS666]ABE42321.1 intradiol ring-cleavage dioxygenase [Polaromonas sp. JS666]